MEKTPRVPIYVLIAALVASSFGLMMARVEAGARPDIALDEIVIEPLQPAVNQPVRIEVRGHNGGSADLTNLDGFNQLVRDFPGFSFIDDNSNKPIPVPTAEDPIEPEETFIFAFEGWFTGGRESLLTIEVDELDELEEEDDNNNSLSTTVRIFESYELADLSLNSVSVTPSAPRADEAATIIVRGTYHGAGGLMSRQGIGSLAKIVDSFNFNGDGLLTPEPSVDSPLGNGESFTWLFTGSFADEGLKTVMFGIDDADEIVEDDETNNTIAMTVTVAEAEEEVPDPIPPVTDNDSDNPGEPDEPTAPVVPFSCSGTKDYCDVKARIYDLELSISDDEKALVDNERDLTTNPDSELTDRLAGSILLQVDSVGEAWYVDPVTKLRYYLRDGETAYSALQAFGLGITSDDLAKIPVGIEDRADKTDVDGDGLDDRLEDALGSDSTKTDSDGDGFDDAEEVRNGFSPAGGEVLAVDQALVDRLEGRILLQVEAHGQAWYMYQGKRYYMKDGQLAYQIMRFLSLGITNTDLHKVSVGSLE